MIRTNKIVVLVVNGIGEWKGFLEAEPKSPEQKGSKSL